MSLSLSQQTQMPELEPATNGMSAELLALVIPAEDQVEDVWRRELLKWKMNYYTCARCNRPFRELDNIGQWACSQHAYSALRTGIPIPGNKWPCCGQRIKVDQQNDRGCVPCDHTIYQKAWDHEGDYKIPLAIFDQYFTRVAPRAVVTIAEYQVSRTVNQPFGDRMEDNEFARGFAFIRRFDKEEHEARVQQVHMTLTPNSNSIIIYNRDQYKWRHLVR